VTVESIPVTTRVVTLAARPQGRPVPADFGLEEQPLGELGAGQLLVRNVYMSVDPSMRGRMEPTEKHYTVNFEVGGPLDGSAIGRVIASRADGFAAGDFVRHRLGWRDYAVVPAGVATVVDPSLAPLPAWLGVLGQTGFTAYVGLRRVGELRPGDVVFVSAAAGAVGSAAGQFARLLGASRVIGSTGGAEKARILTEELGFDEAIDYRAGADGAGAGVGRAAAETGVRAAVAAGLAAAAPDGIDLYFDNVGGDHLVAALYALKVRGRVALCGMISTMEGASPAPGIQHMIQAVLKRLELRGFIVRDHEDLRPEFERRVAAWLRTGELVSRQTVVDGLENAVGALIGLLSGANVGKMLVRLSDEPSGDDQ
jgi:NADPH-dependent curcumin reductase CurA